MVRLSRRTFDLVSGYVEQDVDQVLAKAKLEGKMLSVEQLRKDNVIMDEKQWMARIIFLESIAGVPVRLRPSCWSQITLAGYGRRCPSSPEKSAYFEARQWFHPYPSERSGKRKVGILQNS